MISLELIFFSKLSFEMKNNLTKLIVLTFLAHLVAGFLIFETPNQLDTPNPSDLDQCSSKLFLPDNITFSNATYGHIWVCNNGILSFSFADTRSVPQAFPLDETAIIAPLWSNVDIRGLLEDEKANKITWRVEYNQTNLDHVDSLLREHTDVKRFGATWAFVATWNKVGYYPSKIDLLNTFQVAITCNEQATKRCFCLLAYEDIQWTMTMDQQVHSQAGINDGSGRRDMQTIEFSCFNHREPLAHENYRLTRVLLFTNHWHGTTCAPKCTTEALHCHSQTV